MTIDRLGGAPADDIDGPDPERRAEARRVARRAILVLSALLGIAGCKERATAPVAPPRARDPIVFADRPSVIAVDLALDLAELERALDAEIPRRLASITRKDVLCVPSQKVDLALFSVDTPKIRCDIDGTLTRGRLRISGRGRDLTLRVPVAATVVARDIGGVLKRETGTAAADLELTVRLDLARDWRLAGDVAVDYAWSREPGIDFLGQRITFTRDVDKEIAPLRARIETGLERALARIELQAAAMRGWRSAHAVLELNRENPAVWGRITPRRFHYGGYRIAGRSLRLTLGLEGVLDTFVGIRPPPLAPGTLPPVGPLAVAPGHALLRVPVVADYAVLEPVIAKALARRATRPFELGKYGTVTARFEDIEVYGTPGNRIAVGMSFAAQSDLLLWPKARGRLWLTARPMTAPNSRQVGFGDVAIVGATDMIGEDLLFALANSEELKSTIADALRQNFERDFAKLRGKIDRAIAFRRDGPVAFSVDLERVETGRIAAYGQGLYLPVELHARVAAELVKAE